MEFVFFIIGACLFLSFYYFVVLPTQVKKYVCYRKEKPSEVSYHADLNNIKTVINRATCVSTLNLCYESIKFFKLRNKYLKKLGHDVDLQADIDDLYSLLDKKYAQLNNL